MDETTGSVGSPKSTELALSDEQRGRIYDGVMLVPDATVAHVAAPAVADPLPRDVPLHDLPAGVTRDVPLVRGPQICEIRRPDSGRQFGKPRGGRNDPALQAVALASLLQIVAIPAIIAPRSLRVCRQPQVVPTPSPNLTPPIIRGSHRLQVADVVANPSFSLADATPSPPLRHFISRKNHQDFPRRVQPEI